MLIRLALPTRLAEASTSAVEKKVHGNIERWVNNEHAEDICYQSEMSRLPLNDNLAMKVLDVKYNEEEFLRIGNRRKIMVRH